MNTHTLQTLEILAELDVDVLADALEGLAVLVIALSVEEPVRDVELTGVLHDADELLDLIRGELTSAFGEIDLSLTASRMSSMR